MVMISSMLTVPPPWQSPIHGVCALRVAVRTAPRAEEGVNGRAAEDAGGIRAAMAGGVDDWREWATELLIPAEPPAIHNGAARARRTLRSRGAARVATCSILGDVNIDPVETGAANHAGRRVPGAMQERARWLARADTVARRVSGRAVW
jgi:hypothetical protein